MTTPSSIAKEATGVAPETLVQDREYLRHFISRAVHDLREPLRAMRLGVQMKGSGVTDPTDEQAACGAGYFEEGADRLELLIHDIGEFCYEEVRDPEMCETDLEMALREAESELAVQIKSCGAAITHDPLPSVIGSFSSLVAALRCLLGNAFKFRREEAPHVHVATIQQRAEWIVSVRDNGLGFDPIYRERIFRPFERLNGWKYPGSGLGLTLAKRIVEHHGGRIWADSLPGEGSTFRFTLPLAGL